MPHVHTRELIQRPIVAANVITLEQAEAFVAAAESTGIALILQISENTALFHSGLAPLTTALLSLAEGSSASLGVHLDHATSENLVRDAVALGVRSVMFDASTSSDDENIARTAALVQELESEGVWVEGEIGEIGGKGGAHAPGVLTPVSDGVRFAQETGVHGLAVAVGSSHHMRDKRASLDFQRIEALNREIGIPLVLHGSSGVDLFDIKRAVSFGIAKINVATEFNVVFVAAIREALDAQPSLVDPRKYLLPGRQALQEAMGDYLQAVAGT